VQLTIGSLFSGIGALELGLMRAGLGPVLWQAERDEFCRRVLARHFPKARRYEDVRDVDRSAAPVDVVCGGFPCQDLSYAGAGAGLDGERSGLWRELVRVAREVGPRYLVVENVSALLVRGLGTILGELAESGFDASWDCVPASSIGAPHRRDRLLLVAWRVSDADSHAVRERAERGDDPARTTDARDAEPRYVGATKSARAMGHAASARRERRPQRGQRREERESIACARSEALADAHRVGHERRRESAAAQRAGNVLADADRWRREVERIARRQPGDEGAPRRVVDGCRLPIWPPGSDELDAWAGVPTEAQPSLRRVADGDPGSMDSAERRARLHALGNAVVPAVVEVVGRLIAAAERERLQALRELASERVR
jgi:DNA (cytosine-5)-methyltransferase 1